ncbi:MAG TPA: hypothetical protein ENN20_04255 [Candidatus Marinimicrobia bacterium]|nr:hypothetical protein [Candidatus Neomarinimicrobiota bacterium]
MPYKVSKVISGNTFIVCSNWEWNGETGNIVQAIGLDTPEKNDPGFEYAKRNLKLLICGEEVDLIEPFKIIEGRLLCKVTFEGKDLSDYFTKYE